MAALRRSLDTIYVTMTMHHVGKELRDRVTDSQGAPEDLDRLMDQVQTLVGKFK
jgi:DNA-binding FrmR family transcriptional regulator